MDKKEFVALEVGNIAVVLSGAAGVALAIIGLAGIYPVILMGAAAIAIGASFTIAGIAIAAEKRKILAESTGGTLTSPGMFTFGIGMELIAGITSIVLGILALLGIHPTILLGADVIVLGLALLQMSSTDARINAIHAGKNDKHRVAYDIAKATIDMQILAGLALIALGVLSLVNVAPIILLLVSFLSAGVVLALKGTTLGVRIDEEYNEANVTLPTAS